MIWTSWGVSPDHNAVVAGAIRRDPAGMAEHAAAEALVVELVSFFGAPARIVWAFPQGTGKAAMPVPEGLSGFNLASAPELLFVRVDGPDPAATAAHEYAHSLVARDVLPGGRSVDATPGRGCDRASRRFGEEAGRHLKAGHSPAVTAALLYAHFQPRGAQP